MVRALKLFTYGLELDFLERTLAKTCGENPEGANVEEFQRIFETQRDTTVARIKRCLSQRDDEWVKNLCGNSPLLTDSQVAEGTQKMLNFRDTVRSQLGNDYLVGNIALHAMSLGQENG